MMCSKCNVELTDEVIDRVIEISYIDGETDETVIYKTVFLDIAISTCGECNTYKYHDAMVDRIAAYSLTNYADGCA